MESEPKADPTPEGAPANETPKRVRTRRRRLKRSRRSTSDAGTSRPAKTLPSSRIAFAKQIEILRGYASAYAPDREGSKGITNAVVASLVNLNPSTISLANPFFADVGLLKRVDGGGHLPSAEVIRFQSAYGWNPETAGQELTGPLRDSWFGHALLPALQMRALSEQDALQRLAIAASVGKEREAQLRLVIDYLQLAELVSRDGNLIKGVRGGGNQRDGQTRVPTPAGLEAPSPSSRLSSADRPDESSRVRRFKLIEGALDELPEAETWQEAALKQWLELFELALRVRYKLPASDQD
jgi:hypothetical protein